MVRFELSMTCASSAMVSGEVRRVESCRVARGDGILQTLAGPAPGADIGGGVDVEFVGRLGKDRGADVAAFHDDIVVARKRAAF
jgi:hypothetical protein